MTYTTNAPSTSGADFASDIIGGINYPKVKLVVGADGNVEDITSANGLTVSGTVTANLGATDNAVLDTIAANTSNLTNCIVQDDAPFTPATGYLMMIGGEFDDAAPDSVDEGDAGNVRITANRSMHTSIRDAAGNERGLNIDANGEIGVTNQGTFAVQVDGDALTALQTIDNSIVSEDGPAGTGVNLVGGRYDSTARTLEDGDAAAIALDVNGHVITSPHASSIGLSDNLSNTQNLLVDESGAFIGHGTFPYMFDGSTWDRLRGDATNGLTVNLGTNNDVVAAGNVAHDSADSGNPVKIGGYAKATPSGSAAVADADRTDFYADLDGYQLFRGAAHGDMVNGVASTTSVTDTSVLAAGGASVKQYITDAIIANTSATDITVDIKDGSTTKATFPVPANGGVVHSFKTPIGGTANTAWNFSPSANADTVTCTLSGYKSRV